MFIIIPSAPDNRNDLHLLSCRIKHFIAAYNAFKHRSRIVFMRIVPAVSGLACYGICERNGVKSIRIRRYDLGFSAAVRPSFIAQIDHV